MTSARFAEWLETEWLHVPVVAAGHGDQHSGRTPDAYVLVEASSRLRIDVYLRDRGTGGFRDVVVWRDYVAVGLGDSAFLVSRVDRTYTSILFDDYFGSFTAMDDYLLVASGSRLTRFDPDGRPLWTADDLGVDGVLVHAAGPTTIAGQGQWDPPDGWRPFTLDARSGRVIDDREA